MRQIYTSLAMIALVLSSPRVVEADGVTANVAVHTGGQYAPLEVDEFVFSNWTRYYWHTLPAFAQEQSYVFWQMEATGMPSPEDGITSFEVLTDGPVFLACTTRWGEGGNSSGDWLDEVTTREQLEQQGWTEDATGLGDARDGYDPPFHEYIVFRRDCAAGEEFTYRTEKYRAPLVILSESAVPEPSTVLLLAIGVPGLCVGSLRRRNRSSMA